MAGPNTFNFTQAYEAIFRAQGEGLVGSSMDIAAFAARVLGDPGKAAELGQAAFDGAAQLGGAVTKTVAAIEDLLASHARA